VIYLQFMKCLVLISIFVYSQNCYAQIKISGTILNEKNKPVYGASISIKDSYDGATSDSTGKFYFITTEKGKQILLVTAIGYKDFSDTINFTETDTFINIKLKPQAQSLDAVVITVGTFEAGDEKRSAELSSLDVVTTASANGDITSAIKTLPGTQQVGESDGLFVRGGTADESKIYIDGTLVNNFFYTSEPGQATRGRFNPFLFKGTVFSSGGYGALYGQALSSVLLLESIDLPDRTSASLGLSYISANAGIQKLTKNKKSSWGINYSYTNLELAYNLVKQKMNYFKLPVVHELDVNFRIKTSASGILKYYGYFNHSNLGFRYNDVDSLNLRNAFQLKNFNTYQNISWREKLGSGWKIRVGASYSNNRDNIKSDLENDSREKLPVLNNPVYDFKTFHLTNNENYVNARWTLEKNLGGLSAIRFGNEYLYSNEQANYSSQNEIQNNSRIIESLLATYLESDIYLNTKLALRTGLRSEYSHLFRRWNFAPRISLAYQFPDLGQLSIAYGIYYQDPSNKYLPSVNKLHFEKATQYVLQYQKMVNQRIIRVETYYKKYNDLIKTNGGYGKLTAINNNGFGTAKGVEFFWRDKKTLKNFDYWLSYSFINTKRDFLNYPYSLRPPFAATHTASLVTKTLILKFKLQVNASYTFASGRPFYDIFQNPADHFSIRQQGRTKGYNDLSFSLNYLPQLGKSNAKGFSVFVFSVTNIPGFNNVFSYNFSADGNRKIAVLPPAKRFYYLGYFISFGIDRTQEAIDNHL